MRFCFKKTICLSLLITPFLFPSKVLASANILHTKHLFDIPKNNKIISLNQPSAIVIIDNNAYVLDGVNSRVAVFDLKGNYLPSLSFGKRGKGNGEFEMPLGLCEGPEEQIFIADSGNHRIQVFDKQGKFIKLFNLTPDKYGASADPTDLAIDETRGRCIIVDNDNHRLIVYSLEGNYQSEFGGVGYEEGKFRYPYSIVLDSKKNWYVVDVINTRVQSFDPDGKFIRSIGRWGIEKGQFFRPQGCAIDDKDHLYVSESYEYIGAIQVFDTENNFLAIVGDDKADGKSKRDGKNKRVGKRKFNVPTDMCIYKDRLYVVEMYGNKVGVYSLPTDIK
ncbi:MAG: NHL repeat-containing protein [bacterium]